MNLVDCIVTKVNSKPYQSHSNWWLVDVEYDSYGVISTMPLYFKTRGEAEKVTVGYEFKN